MVNMCMPHATPLRTITCAALACMFGEIIINFGDLVKKIRQFAKLKSPQKFPAIRYNFFNVLTREHSVAHYSLHTV